MHPIPVSLSLSATFLSALTILGTPTEVYTYGTMFLWIVFAMFVATAGTSHIFLPVFYHLDKTSCFEYIQMRFGTVTRIFASILFLLQTLLYMGFVLYAPSLAFQAVTDVSLWGSMIGVAAVCTLYTTLGGMKTVLWTDSLQLVVMLTGLMALLIEGSLAVGGFFRAWGIAKTGGRIEFLNVSADPRTRHSVWSVGIGASFFWSYLYGVNQAQVQRQCSLPTLRKAQVAVWLNLPWLVLIVTLTVLTGVVMYAFYVECDPVKFGLVNKSDQIIPLMVLDVLGTLPGLPGVFMACVFSGSLSSISSGLNAMSAVILEDFVKRFCCRSLLGKRELVLSKIIVTIIGFAMFGMAVLISQASGMIIQLSYTLYSILSGPLLGCFVAGVLFPWTNKYGATVGLLVSLTIMCWLGTGAQVDGPEGTKPLTVSTVGCNWNATGTTASGTLTDNFLNSDDQSFITLSNLTTTSDNAESSDSVLDDFYRMSYQWYTGFGMLVNITVALLVSFLTGRTDPKHVDCRLISPVLYTLSPCLPQRVRKHLHLGVIYREKNKNESSIQLTTKGKENAAFTREC